MEKNTNQQYLLMGKLWSRITLFGVAAILLFSTVYYFISRDALSKEIVHEPYSQVETVATVGEMLDGTELVQSFPCHSDFMRGILVRFANYGNVPEGTVHLELVDSAGETLAEARLQAADLEDSADYYFNFGRELVVRRNDILSLRVRIEGGRHQAAITMWAGLEQPECKLVVSGNAWKNTLYIVPDGYRSNNFTAQHWQFACLLLIAWLAFCVYQSRKALQGKKTGYNEIIHIFGEYRFLLKRLITGEFINKYRRSYLGILWSLLNPLLMMIIMSVVFSVVFRFASIPNFQVYLILGQVMFSFYSESTQVSVMTIVGAGQLIKKAYLPKYIFPLSKVVFSFVNMAISYIAVFLVMLFYHVPLTINCLYLPLVLGTYFIFCLGIGLILSALMVFIRDTLHLYTVLLTALGYLTPIFYSVDMLPTTLQRFLKLNPLYHYITAVRTILLYGRPLNLQSCALLIGMAVLSLTLGVQYFHSKQNKFILYI